MSDKKFSYHSEQVHTSMVNGEVQEKRNIVDIQNGKGTKTVIVSTNGQPRSSTKKLSKSQIKKIKNEQFVPKLFKPCYDCLRTKSKSRSRTQKKKASS